MTRRKVSGIDWVYRDRTTGRYYVRVQAHESPQHEGAETPWVDEFVAAGVELHEAVAMRERVRADLERGTFFIDAYKPVTTPTLSELVEDLAHAKAGAGRRQATVYEFRFYASKWQPMLGDLPADAVNYNQVRAWWTHIQQNETPLVCNKSMMTLRAAIEHARSIGARIDPNPTRALLRAKVPVVRDRPRLDLVAFRKIIHEMRRFDRLAIIGGDAVYMGHAPYLLTMAALAARGGEVCNLQWQDLDRENNIITLWDTKTAPSLLRQTSDELTDELDLHLERMKKHSPPAMAESDYMFPQIRGGRATSGRPKNYWAQAVERAGYISGRADNGWTPHDVRRLGIELLYEAGGQERDVMQFVGHHVAKVHAMYLQRDSKRLSKLANRSAARLFAGGQPRLPGDPEPAEDPADSENSDKAGPRGDP